MRTITPEYIKRKAATLPGGYGRTTHDCGEGAALQLTRRPDGTRAYCYRCHANGWLPSGESFVERMARRRRAANEDAEARVAACLPHPATGLYSSEDWPAQFQVWVYKAGLSAADTARHGLYYSRELDRVVIPFFNDRGELLFWQARSMDKDRIKYLSPKDVTKPTPRYGVREDGPICLTEDALSAMKVSKVAEAWALLGTSLKMPVLAELIKADRLVAVMLDPDGPGREAARTITNQLRMVGLRVSNILFDTDPKLVHQGALTCKLSKAQFK